MLHKKFYESSFLETRKIIECILGDVDWNAKCYLISIKFHTVIRRPILLSRQYVLYRTHSIYRYLKANAQWTIIWVFFSKLNTVVETFNAVWNFRLLCSKNVDFWNVYMVYLLMISLEKNLCHEYSTFGRTMMHTAAHGRQCRAQHKYRNHFEYSGQHIDIVSDFGKKTSKFKKRTVLVWTLCYRPIPFLTFFSSEIYSQ